MSSTTATFNALNRKAETLRASLEVLDQRMDSANRGCRPWPRRARRWALRSWSSRVEPPGTAGWRGGAPGSGRRTNSTRPARPWRWSMLNCVRACRQEHGMQRELLAREGRLEALQRPAECQPGREGRRAWLVRQGIGRSPLLVNCLERGKRLGSRRPRPCWATGWRPGWSTAWPDNTTALEGLDPIPAAPGHEATGRCARAAAPWRRRSRRPDAIRGAQPRARGGRTCRRTGISGAARR